MTQKPVSPSESYQDALHLGFLPENVDNNSTCLTGLVWKFTFKAYAVTWDTVKFWINTQWGKGGSWTCNAPQANYRTGSRVQTRPSILSHFLIKDLLLGTNAVSAGYSTFLKSYNMNKTPTKHNSAISQIWPKHFLKIRVLFSNFFLFLWIWNVLRYCLERHHSFFKETLRNSHECLIFFFFSVIFIGPHTEPQNSLDTYPPTASLYKGLCSYGMWCGYERTKHFLLMLLVFTVFLFCPFSSPQLTQHEGI